MKVGIMSMQRIDNYGSFLQAYALKTMIEQLGAEVVYVDYHAYTYPSITPWKNLIPMRKLKRLLKPFIDLKLPDLTPAIRNEYKALGLDDKRHYRTKVDLLIIGSDEVFNYIQKNPAVGYSPELLGMGNRAKKVISYAASCGNLTVDTVKKFQQEKMVGRLLNQFAAISVRDDNTRKVVEQLSNKKVEYHLDPTLVGDIKSLTRDECILENYMIVYGYEYRFNDEEIKKIIAYAEKNKEKIIIMSGHQNFGDEYVACSPFEVLSYFEHANHVITDTFHGTIFSILTHKKFLTISRSDADVGYGNENKVVDLLERLELTDRLLHRNEKIAEKMNRDIDYNNVDNMRNEARKHSMKYLSTYIK